MLYGDFTPAGGVMLKYQLIRRTLLRITTNYWLADVQILIVFVYTFEGQCALDTRFVKKNGMIDLQIKFIAI